MLNFNELENRSIFLMALLICVITLLGLRTFYVQIIQGGKHYKESADIRARNIPALAPRGIVYDRRGKILALNKPRYDAYLIPSEVNELTLHETLDFAQRVLKVDSYNIKKEYEKKKVKTFEPIEIKKFLNMKEVSILEENKERYPELVVSPMPVRYYPYKNMCAHVLGYVGKISKEEWKKKQKGKEGYILGDVIGKLGIEESYDNFIRGINGGRQIEVDAHGTSIRTMKSVNPIPGNNIYLTIDVDMQKTARELIGKEKGSVVVMDVKNGEVLALVSKPDFDPNMFSKKLTKWQWAHLRRQSHPLHNRAITAFPPGSIFKVVTLWAALERLKNLNRKFYCPGYYWIGRRKADCWRPEGHRKISLFWGLIESCDIVFYTLGRELGEINGADTMHEFAKKYGLGEKTNIALRGEEAGSIPTSKWKLKRFNTHWYPGDSINMAIGQGFVTTSPLQMAALIAAIANGSDVFQPKLVRKISSVDGTVKLLDIDPIVRKKLDIKEEHLSFIRRGLRKVVTDGTGRAVSWAEITIAGKTGTAEDNPRPKPHAWFICYAPYEKPQIAIAVFLQNAGHGGSHAAPIARELVNWYYKYRMKK
ncbi:penicillin-binding protein 2 [Candidatus Margulisiibacteriota bacterium]